MSCIKYSLHVIPIIFLGSHCSLVQMLYMYNIILEAYK